MKSIFKNLMTVLVLSLLVSHVGLAQQQGFNESELQSNFAEAVKSLPNVLQAQ